MKKFLLQSDEGILEIEKRAIHSLSLLEDNIEIIHLSFEDLQNSTIYYGYYCPVGSVEFVQLFLLIHGIKIPMHISYPEPLFYDYYLRRKVRIGKFHEADNLEFIKPLLDIKGFTGNLKFKLSGIPDDYCVYISDPVKFIQEYRFYILNNELVGYARYDDNYEEDRLIDFELIDDAIRAMKDLNIIGYSLDFGILSTGQTALIEANDGWSLGLYKGSCSNKVYCNLIWSRFQQMSKNIQFS